MAGEAFRLVIPQDMLNKLQTADEKLAQLGKTSQNTQSQVIAAFKAMADGVNPFIQKLNEAQQALGNIKAFKGGDIKLGNIATEATKSADAVNELVQVIAKLVQENKKLQEQQLSSRGITIAQEGTLGKKESNLNYKSLTNDVKELHNAELNRESRERIKEANRIARLTRLPSTIDATTAQNIISKSGSAVSINQMLTSIKNLEKAKRDLDTTDKNYKKTLAEIDNALNKKKQSLRRLGVETENVRKHQSNLMNHAQQLRRALALVFSVSQITGYINKMIQVRGEFELQQRSLQAILQNKDEADKLWQQTVDLAVRSPFRVKELVSYTKQLAAYRVETEKLHDTTKMLSDVSAGLGVDMQRLILAYGQVKAANYLRGTELRQFSEAGINILGELAKYFTELEGRAVSVGEVFERVSKRMVAFSDVEEIFKRVTSEGGVFYRMQEIQSETVKGLISNLYDQVDLMLNDIGKSNDGALKSAIGLVKSLVENWRTLAPYIQTAGETFALYFSAKTLAKIAKGFTTLWATISAHPIAAAVTAISFLVLAIYNVVTANDELTASMLEVEKSVSESLEESISLYRELTDTINDATKSLDERNRAYEQLKSKFKDILPDQYTELKYIEDISFNYKKAEDAMFSYYNAKAIQQKKDKIEGLYEGDIEEEIKNITTATRENIDELENISIETKYVLKSAVSGITREVVEMAKSGELAFDEIENEITKRLAQYAKIEETVLRQGYAKGSLVSSTYHDELLNDLKDYLIDRQNALKDIQGMPYQNIDQKRAYELQQTFQKEIDVVNDYFKQLVNLRKLIADNKIDLSSPVESLNPKQAKKREWYLNNLQNIYSGLAKDAPQYEEKVKELDRALLGSANKGAYEYTLALGGIENQLLNIFATNAKSLKSTDEGAQAMLKNFAEGLQQQADSKIATPLMKSIVSAFNKAISDKQLSQSGKDLLAKLIPNEKQSKEDVRKAVQGLLKQYQDEVKKWENATLAGATTLPLIEYLNKFGNTDFKSAMGVYLGSDSEFNELQNKVIPVIEHINRLLGGDPPKEKGSSNDLFEERLRVIKKLHKAYKELRKKFEHTDAVSGAWDKYGDAFIKAYQGTALLPQGYKNMTSDEIAKIIGYPTEQGMIDFYNELIKLAKNKDEELKVALASGEIIWELKVEEKGFTDEELKNELESLFSGYELSLELQKLNIPPDLAKQLFNVDSLTLPELKTQLQGMESQFVGTDMEKEYREALRKVDEMERKAQEERLKKYVAFSRKALSERAKIKLQELQTIEDIEKTFAIKQEDSEEIKATKRAERARALAQAQKEANDAIQKLDWEDFKSSDTFNNIFDDLEHASDEVLKSVIQRLKDFKDQWKDMPFEQMRQVVDLLNKAEGALNEKSNPFVEAKRLRGLIKADGRTTEQAQVDMFNAEQMKATKENELAVYELFEQVDAKLLAATSLTTEQQKKYVEWQNLSVKEQKLLVQGVKDEISAQQGVIDKANIQLNNVKKLKNAYEEQADAISKIDKMANDLYDSFKGLSEALGGDSDSPEAIFADMGMNMASTVMQTIQLQKELQAASVNATAFGAAMNAAMGVIGWIVMAVQLLTQAISAMVKAHDNNLENQIQDQIERVEELEHSYKKLEKAIAEAYSAKGILDATENAQKNLDSQISSYRAMIAAEEQKKNADNDRISEWERTIEELEEQREQLKKDMVESLGGSYDYRNVASDWASAWLDSFKETGNGLKGLQESFDEFIENLIVQQLAAKIAGKHAKNILDVVNNALEDGVIDELEAGYINTAKEMGIKAANAEMEAFASLPWVQQWMDGSTSNLSGLTEGIKGITESTAQIIEAYLNSLRFFVSKESENISNIERILTSNEETGNPILSELRAQTSLVREIREVLGDVVFVGHSKGGSGLKVFMD